MGFNSAFKGLILYAVLSYLRFLYTFLASSLLSIRMNSYCATLTFCLTYSIIFIRLVAVKSKLKVSRDRPRWP